MKFWEGLRKRLFPGVKSTGKTKCVVLWLLVGLRMFQCGFAQDTAKKQVWFDVTKYFAVGERFRLGGDAGIRGFVFDEEWTGVYFRPSIIYALNERLTLHGGVGLFSELVTDPGDRFEIRPWGGIKFKWPQIGKIRLEQYFRAEERYFRREEPGEFAPLLRLRYRIGAYLPISRRSLEKKGLYLPLLYEFFWIKEDDTAGMFMYQHRLVLGLGYRVNSKWRIEFQYTRMMYRENVGTGFVPTDQVFRIRLNGL